MRMSELYMLIGVPGSGKSTWVKERFESGFFKEDIHVVISTDDIIEEVAQQNQTTYDVVFKTTIDWASKEANRRLEKAIQENKHIIWDQTNLTQKSRSKKLAKIPYYYIKFAVCFDVPEKDELFRRLNDRPNKTINKSVIENMLRHFEFPKENENFHTIFRISQNQASK